MRLIKSSDVQRLTGLTADQLREWTARRGIIEPDSKPSGPGTRARYAWQTVLLLRLAVVLRETFHIELQSQRSLFTGLAARLAKVSFPSLRGRVLVLRADGTYDVAEIGGMQPLDRDAVIVHLDPHLDVLSAGFGFAEPIRQLPLFPAVAIR